jgi:predicted DsbA family dithiol-disulfide isomerase
MDGKDKLAGIINRLGEGKLDVTYYTDPLCCWSWAFEPVWEQLRFTLQDRLSYRYCMSGLIAGWDQYHDTINDVRKPLQMGPVWKHAAVISGRPMQDRIWFFDPPSSSYPACLAVKCALHQSTVFEEAMLVLLREAVMDQGKNISRREVLLEIAANLERKTDGAFNASLFEKELTDETVIDSLRRDINEVKHLQIKRFPTFIVSYPQQKGKLILTGYRPFDALIDSLSSINNAPSVAVLHADG